MRLTDEERAMLDGAHGRPVRKAMEIVTALGTIYEAEDLVAVSHVQVSGVSYQNLGEAGLEFLREWAGLGARVQVPTTLNPAGMDVAQWAEMGVSYEFAAQQQAVLDVFAAMGITLTCTCTPYLVGFAPAYGDHLAWGESSAVSFANSVLGARTNREGGPGALAAAITGRTARYGLHLEQNRLPTCVVDVDCPVRDSSEFGALGYLAGRAVKNGVPYFRGLDPAACTPGSLKALGAAAAASGAVALYHVEGVTPEARQRPEIGDMREVGEAQVITIDSLDEGYAALGLELEPFNLQLDLVWIGCPHASLDEIAFVAARLEGKTLRVPVWITAARQVRQQAAQRGYLQIIERAGGRIVSDTCLVVAPVRDMGVQRLATNSAKGAFYGPSHAGLEVCFGSTEQCLQAALDL
ncbi:MAG: aconitase X catalytic domain-containing protein [Thermoflexales bacterium]|nr:aconitase X catalytic domain-containing protein [Thermoflexales bacterium]